MILSALVIGLGAWAGPLTKLEARYPHFAHAELERPAARRLDVAARHRPQLRSFLRDLHRTFDERVRTLAEDVVCREALAEDDIPELLVRLARRRLRLRNLLIVASWLEVGDGSLAELGRAFAALLALDDAFDSITVALEDWGRHLEREQCEVPVLVLLDRARALWLAHETQSHGGGMTGRSTDRVQ